MDIKERTFLITGGSSGLGAACVRRLAGCGGNVVIADVNEHDGAALAGEIGDRGVFIRTDVTDESSVQNAIRSAIDRFGSLRGLVNCAGVELARKVLGRRDVHSLEEFNRVVQVNLVGTFNATRLASQAIAQAEPDADGERGVVINTASIAAYEGQVGQAAYSASKGGVVSMTLPLARELAQHGIRVVTIAPGVFDTPLLARLPSGVREKLEAETPFPQRLGHPDEFAALVQHIIENRMLNGEVIRLDGGLRMNR